MISFKDFLTEDKEKKFDPPNILIMRRQSIRQFPGGKKVALYKIDKLDKVVTIPYNDTAMTVEEIESYNESNEE